MYPACRCDRPDPDFRIDGVRPQDKEAYLVTPPKAFANGLAMHWLERAHRERNVQVVSLKRDPALSKTPRQALSNAFFIAAMMLACAEPELRRR